MIKLTEADLMKKYNACVKSLDENKNCSTCKNKENDSMCRDCFDMMLGFPCNPTNWEIKTN